MQHIITVKIKLSLLFCGILTFSPLAVFVLLFSFVALASSFLLFFAFDSSSDFSQKFFIFSDCKSPLYRKFFIFVSTFFIFVIISFDTFPISFYHLTLSFIFLSIPTSFFTHFAHKRNKRRGCHSTSSSEKVCDSSPINLFVHVAVYLLLLGMYLATLIANSLIF